MTGRLSDGRVLLKRLQKQHDAQSKSQDLRRIKADIEKNGEGLDNPAE